MVMMRIQRPRMRRLPGQIEQRPDVIDLEAEIARVPDEAEAPDVGLALKEA